MLSTEKLQDLRIDTECLDCFRRIVDSKVRPLLLLEDHVGADDAALADRVQGLVIGVPVREHDVYNARLQDHDLGALLPNCENVLARFEKLLPGSVEQLAQDVLVCIVKEFDVALAEFHEFFALQIVRIVYYLVYDELAQIVKVRQEFIEFFLLYHTNCAIGHGLDGDGWIAVEYGTSLSFY